MSHQAHGTARADVIQLLTEHGFEGMAQVMELLLNEVMKWERTAVLLASLVNWGVRWIDQHQHMRFSISDHSRTRTAARGDNSEPV